MDIGLGRIGASFGETVSKFLRVGGKKLKFYNGAYETFFLQALGYFPETRMEIVENAQERASHVGL